MSDLPAGVRRDLDRAAAGIGRTATTAHPACVCGRLTGEFSNVWSNNKGDPFPLRYGKDDCPQHRPEVAP